MTREGNVFTYQTRSKFKLISVCPAAGHINLPLLAYTGCLEFTLNPVCQHNIFLSIHTQNTSLLNLNIHRVSL